MRPHAEWTHPDFLDHLASELVEHHYSILPAQLPPDLVDTLVRRLEALDRQGLMQPAATVLERVQPTGGTLVVFLSERLPHEVLPARRSRYSAATALPAGSTSAPEHGTGRASL